MKKRAQNHAEESGLIGIVDFWLTTFKRTVIREGKHAVDLEQLIPDVKAQDFFKNLFTDKWGARGYLWYQSKWENT
jgi:hypothetical protein